MDRRIEQRLIAVHAARAKITRSLQGRYRDGEAADYVDEAILRMAVAEDIRDEAHACAWTTTKAHGLAIDASRHRRSVIRHAAKVAAPDTCESAEDVCLRMVDGQRAMQFLRDLPPAQRAALSAQADGSSLEEIAEELGRSVYAVKNLLRRAKSTVRQRLEGAQLGLAAAAARCRRWLTALDFRVISVAGDAALRIPVLLTVIGVFHGAAPTSQQDAGRASEPAAAVTAGPRVAEGSALRSSAQALLDRALAGQLPLQRAPITQQPPRHLDDVDSQIGTHDVGHKSHDSDTSDSDLAKGDVASFLADTVACLEHGPDISPQSVSCKPDDRQLT